MVDEEGVDGEDESAVVPGDGQRRRWRRRSWEEGGVVEEATASDEGHRLRKSWAED